MSTRKEKARKAAEEREKRSYKLKPIYGDSIGEKMVSEQVAKPAKLSVDNVKTSGNAIDDKAMATSQLGKPAELHNLEKRQTVSDMLAPMRESAIKEKTDAEKMQKYYALADVFTALGKMGGAAIGGAIGGNMLDSAPVVGEYQPSRGYIAAFEEAKKANERLRNLDNQEFQLSYSKQQRDKDMAYKAMVAREDREYNEKKAALDREFRVKLAVLNADLTEAAAKNDYERTKALKESITKLQGDYDLKLKAMGQQTTRLQAQLYNTIPLRFSDGTNAMVPDNYYESLKNSFIGQTINGVPVTKDNVEAFIRQNPKLVGEYLSGWGVETSAPAKTSSAASTNSYAQAVANHKFISAQHTEPATVRKAANSGSGSNAESEIMSLEDKKNKWRNRN